MAMKNHANDQVAVQISDLNQDIDVLETDFSSSFSGSDAIKSPDFNLQISLSVWAAFPPDRIDLI